MTFVFTVSELAGLQTSKYFNIAGTALLMFNYVITFDEEVRWMWGRGWDATRVAFLLSRYLPFAGVGMTAYTALRSNTEACAPSLVDDIIHILSIIASEVLLILRTYAFWQGDKRVLYGLLAYGCVSIGAVLGISLESQYILNTESYLNGTCYLLADRNTTLVYAVLLLFELVILFLTVYKRFRTYRGVGSFGLVHTLYRDGLFYIISIALITFANVIVAGIFPFQFSDLLDIPQITLHSVLAARIMFNLRKSCSPVQVNVGETVDSDEVILSEIVCLPGASTGQSATLVSEFKAQNVASSYTSGDVESGRV